MRSLFLLILLITFSYSLEALDKFTSGLKFPIGLCYYKNSIYVADFTGDRVYKYSEKGKILSKSSKIDGPVSIVSIDKKLLVTSYFEHCLIYLDEDLKEIKRISKKGRNAGDLYFPLGLAVDEKNNIYVADYGNFRVSIFSEEGIFNSKIVFKEKGLSLRPRSITVKDNKLFIICKNREKIYVSDLNGKNINLFNNFNRSTKLRHIKTGKNKYIYITDQLTNSVSIINYDNKLAKTLVNGFKQVEDICFDKKGNIYISDSKGFIYKYSDELLNKLSKIQEYYSKKDIKRSLNVIKKIDNKTNYLKKIENNLMKTSKNKLKIENSINKTKSKKEKNIKPIKKIVKNLNTQIKDKKVTSVSKNNKLENKINNEVKTKNIFYFFIFILILFSLFIIKKFFKLTKKNENIQNKRKKMIIKKRKEYITMNLTENAKKKSKKKSKK